MCPFQLAPPIYVSPTVTHPVAGVVLRAEETEHGAVVSRHQNGRWCVFGGPTAPDQVLALIQKRLNHG